MHFVMRGGHSRDESWRPSHVSSLCFERRLVLRPWRWLRLFTMWWSAGRASVIVRGEARVGRVLRDVGIAVVVVKHSSCVARLLVDRTIRGALSF